MRSEDTVFSSEIYVIERGLIKLRTLIETKLKLKEAHIYKLQYIYTGYVGIIKLIDSPWRLVMDCWESLTQAY